MEPNQEGQNDASSHQLESKTTQSELSLDLKVTDFSTIQRQKTESGGDKETFSLANLPRDNTINNTGGATSKPTRTVENVEVNPGKDGRKHENGGVVSEPRQDGPQHISIAFDARNSSKKRIYSPGVQVGLECREQNILFRPVKRSRFALNNDSRIGRIENLNPIRMNEVLTLKSKSTGKVGSKTDMFDDAEDDNTFDLDSYKKANTSASSIRSDLVAAILGAPAKPNITVAPVPIRPTSSLMHNKRTNGDPKRRKVANKKQKKKSTEKERIAAVALLDGEIDLLRVLPRDDCIFLGEKCFIFTLRQLEWILDDDRNSIDSFARQKGRDTMMRNLREHVLMINGSNQRVGSSLNQLDQGRLATMSTTTPQSIIKEERVKQADSALMDLEVSNGSSNDESLAAKKLDVWKKSIEAWKQETRTEGDGDQFPLVDGPMSTFFPVGTLQFMESIKVKTLFDFLCLKKTESGLIVEMFRAWRKKCGLRDFNLHPLAKHLIGINARIEASLKRKFDAEEDFSKWVAGPMAVLSGAAKEFLVDYSKVFSGLGFIETKTKILADKFCLWRSKEGLSELRGSGNVAMISAWKTQIKDELEIQNSEGKVIPEEEIGDEFGSMSEMVPAAGIIKDDQRSKRRRVNKAKPNQLSSAAYQALNSTEFFSRCFPDERKLAMLKSVGITTAQDLLDADKGKNSILLRALIQYKSEQSSGKDIQAASCVSLLYDWASRVKKRINDVENGVSVVVRQEASSNPNSKGNRDGKKKSYSTDPFDALSKPSKEFLQSRMKISTASEFLETRTTDIANAFIKWREDKGMTPLKGLGAVASISGWKKLVRTKAAAVGDLDLAELNRARHAKNVIHEVAVQTGSADVKRRPVQHRTDGLDKQLGILSDKGKEPPSMQMQSKNIVSALSYMKDEVFHFEILTRKERSKGNVTYLRYLGADPKPAFDLAVHDTSGYEMKECAVVRPNASKITTTGRGYYDSIIHGSIDLRYSRYDPGFEPKGKNSPYNLKYLMQIYLWKSEPEDISPQGILCPTPECHAHQKIEEPRKAFNVFGVMRNGEKSYVLHLPDPIEKGQSVKLQFTPLDVFDDIQGYSIKNRGAENLRNLIEERLGLLPVGMLREVLRYLEKDLAPSVDSSSELNSKIEMLKAPGLAPAPSSMTDSLRGVRARRRAHWLAVKIHENLQKVISRDPVIYKMKTNFFWTKSCVEKFQVPPAFNEASSSIIKEEIRQEVKHEFAKRGFDGFASSMCIWCPLAKSLFSGIVDLFAKFSTEFGGACIGDSLMNELSSLVSEVISELKELYQNSQRDGRENLSKIALVYGESSHHDSNIFPSFQDIKQKYFLQPYSDAMNLCNEPISSIDFITGTRIVAIKRAYESNKNQKTHFEDLHDTKIDEKNRIDIRWYIDTQILAVAMSAIRCGVFTSTPKDVTELLCNIESRIMQSAHEALTELSVESISFEDFKQQQHIVDYSLESEAQRFSRLFSRRSLMTPSASPFFFGFIWPLLKEGGWKMKRGNAPTEVTFLYPITFGNGRAHHLKDSMAKQRSNLAKESSSLGLGYIPKLTKRLLIKCSENAENSLADNAKVLSGPSVRTILDKFVSSLLLKIEKNDEKKNGSEQTKVKKIISELILLFNKMVPLTFEQDDKRSQTEGKEWCDVLGCRYLFKFLMILPNILQEVDIPAHQYSTTIGIVHEIVAFLSDNHQSLFDNHLKLPNEEYDSEPGFPSTLPSQIINCSKTTLGNKAESRKESVEAVLPQDQGDLTDFVAIVMRQTIIGRSTSEHSSRHGYYKAGHPYIVCRHCLGMKKGGKYYYGSYDSIATAVTAVEKHILRCTDINDKVRQDMTEAKKFHPSQRKLLPFGAQSAFFARLFDRMQGLGQTDSQFGSISGFSSTAKHPSASENRRAEAPPRFVNHPTYAKMSHVFVMQFIQDESFHRGTVWKPTKALEKMIDKYYSCLEYGGILCGNKKEGDPTSGSEWLYSKLKM